ncbi:MAG TPA: CDP-alcohol phosphatidyltransferase family protein [Candidatus Pacearchaeota archaeon]|jgi:phosphatidylglycerophosphate synthase|nr:CDP-alcohol phosphatidyltransferase family protein [Candidatus Pacearchaeota archaeon]HRR94593.1 CDP-alcohol phosphatidyltransferase family protein [Candidatus Paceibacterota bacterium]HPC30459.1 CDP-alcohol phosphatidyltransferase family protein [Candidatus Pacearchaeota archaeon]HQG09290.1 CDP-alcohol phosphatidyltransferase family protein [Candidatus Pacearchaeota archaeon]HQH19965.1 CDP-alcohol phosphatidyltransferase family protein [Candidatus Pacearchaeota archaeon]
MLDTKRDLFKSIEKVVGKMFGALPLTPNQYTLISGIMAIISAYFIIKQQFWWAILFFLIASFLDFIDGAVARQKNMSSKIGAYLDTIFDRYVEGIILCGFLFINLPSIFFVPGYVWVYAAMFGSVITTYAKAAAKEKDLVNQELKGGLLSRAERLILIFIALVLAAIYPDYYYATAILFVIAVLANFTALQRVHSAITINRRQKS